MRQPAFFIPLRLAASALAIALAAIFANLQEAKAAVDVILVSGVIEKPEIDPIITGQTVSGDQLEEWKARRAQYEACGLCETSQPYPGELPAK